MRKILAGFMATAMVTSICATASFAASTSASHTFTVTTGNDATTVVNTTADTTYDSITLDLDEETGDTEVPSKVTLPINLPVATTATIGEVAKALSNTTFHDVEFNGKYYNVTLKQVGVTGALLATFSPAANLKADNRNNYTFAATDINLTLQAGTAAPVVFTGNGAMNDFGDGGEIIDKETAGTFDKDSVKAAEVLIAYGDGTPIPLTEKGVGVDKNLNGQGGVQSNNTLYFMIRDDVVPKLSDDSYWKLKISKGDNGKMVKAVSDVTKIFAGNLFDANTGEPVENTGNNERRRYIKVELVEDYTDTEFKISLDMRLTATSKAVSTKIATDDSAIKVKDFSFYMKNITKSADNDWRVGINGLMLNPLGNDWNDVTYYDEDADVAFLRFFGDSDVGKFYAKLSTKWVHADYAAYFNDQDAFYFEFTGSPKMSATSRADLQIYNPFTDVDGNSTFDAATATIYQVIDGDLIDVTDSFTFGEGENGEDAFITRTRFIGTYIICEKPVEEAAGEGDVNDLVPDDGTTTPDDNTTGGGKGPANTGRYA